MTDARSGSRALTQVGRRLATASAALSSPVAAALAAGLTALSGFVLSAGAPAGADQVSSLQAQAAELSRQLLLEQLQVGGLQQQYDVASQRVQADATALAETESHIRAVQGRITAETSQLRHEAVNAYVDNGTAGDPVTALFGTDLPSQDARAVYDTAVAGDLSVTIDQLQSDRQALGAEQADRQRIEAQDQADQGSAAGLLQRAQSTQQELERQSAQVTGQLAEAVAAQQQAQAAAAQAAVRAAQAQAQRSAAPAAPPSETLVTGSTSTSPPANGSSTTAGPDPTVAPTTSPPSRPAPAGGGTDPALPPFLVCVIHYESGGDYQAVSPDGQYMGAFQFSQSTWNVAAQLAGRPDLIGVRPDQASKADQDTLAVALYNADGTQPWYDPCRT